MMRPACAYPPLLQSGLQNGPDMYAPDRDSFGFGLVGQQTGVSSCMPALSSSPAGNLYPIGANPNGGGGVGNPNMQPHASFSVTSPYSQIHMSQQQQQSPYSMTPEMIPSSHMSNAPSPFPGQPVYQQIIGPNGDKIITQNMPMTRASGGLSYGPQQRSSNPGGPQQQPQPTVGGSPYGTMIPGSNVGMPAQQSQQHQPPGRMAPSRTGVQSEAVTSRSVVGPRSISGMSDPSGFQSPSMYVSYPGPATVSQPGPGMQGLPVPYSIAISNPGMSSSIPTMVNSNSSTIPPGANYAPGPTGPNSSSASRSSGPLTAGMQPPPTTAIYQSQQARLPPTGCYNNIMSQSYTQSASGPFRSQSGGPMSRSSTGTSSPTPQLMKDASSCMVPGGGHPGSQPPPCSSAGPGTTGSPIPTTGKGQRLGTNPNSVMIQPGGCLTPNTALTPPAGPGGGLLISGPPQSMVNAMNGCLTLGQDGEVKLNSIQSSDGCYIQTRPMSSGARDPSTMSSMPMNGSIGSSGGDLILCSSSSTAIGSASASISSGFPMPGSMSVTSGGMSYVPGQQMTVIPNEFDTMGSNNSPLMMMTLPTSSPMPGAPTGSGGGGGGGGLMNGGTMPMNVAMGSAAPAPPPYHHHQQQQQHHPPSGPMNNNCRSALSSSGAQSSSFFGSPVSSGSVMTSCCGTGTVTSSTAMQQQHHTIMSQAMSVAGLPDTTMMSTIPDRHFMGQIPGMDDGGTMTPSGVAMNAGMPGTGVNPGKGAHPGSGGAAKSTARPKRTRAKNATGTGRASKASAKKAAAQATSVTPSPTSDPYALNHRVHPQTAVRQKPPNWTMNTNNMCSSTFPSGMMSPTGMSIPGCEMRVGCSSPVTYSTATTAAPLQNGLLMRPNSGPNAGAVNSFANVQPSHGPSMLPVPSPGDTNVPRLTASPRQSPYGPGLQPMQQQQQQQYFSSQPSNGPPVSSPGFYVTGPGNFAGNPQQQQQQPPPGQAMLRTSSSGPQMSYVNPIQQGSGRPQPSQMHFQPHPMSQSGGPYPSSGSIIGRNNVPPSTCPPVSGFSTSNPPGTEGVGPIGGGRTASPGPGTTFVPVPSSTGDTDRLVCPITNGMVWGPTQIQLNDVLHQFLPDGVYVRRFEFDLTANHLQTIVGRTDLDIVVCSHLVSEPLQVCHWPSDAVQIRFNEYLLRLDRSSVHGGQSAHKVACVKQLCRPGRNQLEIAIVGLGEDPNQPATLAKRRAASSTLEMHHFAAFMAHMPALNVLLDGLQRRRPAGVSALCDILEGRASGARAANTPSPVVAELSLICPVFRTRMRVPGRITGCEHIEAFDMEAFLRREVLWPRLNCPICGNKSPAGLDGLCIDTTILNALHLVHPSIDSILVRSDGCWRLTPPICLDLPADMDQWQPLIGPLTEVATQAFQSMLRGSIVRAPQPPPALPYLTSSDTSGLQPLSTEGHVVAAGKSHMPSQKLIPMNRSTKTSNPTTTTTTANSSIPTTTPLSGNQTPGKDMITSPSWSSVNQHTDSPINQTYCAPDKTAGLNMDSGTCDSRSASRPSSQPVTWGHMRSPSAEPHSTNSSTTTPSSAAATTTTTQNNSSFTPHASASPSCTAMDPHNYARYPFSDPVSSHNSSTLHPDGFSGPSTTRPSDCADPVRSKVRRSSTGSTQSYGSGAIDNQLLVGCDRVPPASLPPLSEHMAAELSEQVANRSGWSDPMVSCGGGGGSAHSPFLSAPSTNPPSSLPPSPAFGPRPSSTNTANFSIPAIPGVNMNAIERISNSPSQSASPSTVDVTSSSRIVVVSGALSPKTFIEPSDAVAMTDVVGSSSPHLDSVAAAASVSMLTGDESGASSSYTRQHHIERIDLPSSSTKPASETSAAITQPCEKKLMPSSLNMGLDFLLAEDQASVSGELGNSDQVSSTTVAVEGQPLSNSTTPTITPDPHTLVRPPSREPPSSGAQSMKRTLSLNDSDLTSSIDSSEVASGPASKSSQNHESITTTSSAAQPERMDNSEIDEAALKRIKLDPTLASSKSQPWNFVPSESSLASDQSSCDGRRGEDELSPVLSKPYLTEGCAAPEGLLRTGLPVIPTELDEQCACGESIRALSAQIDRLEVFLDESYVRFVESFSCT